LLLQYTDLINSLKVKASAARHIIGHFGDDFTGQMTQPTV